jgi:hypothetical protein
MGDLYKTALTTVRQCKVTTFDLPESEFGG